MFQEELNYLYHVTHRDPVLSKMEKCDTVLEIVVFAWLSMRKAAKELLDSLESLDSLERVKCESLRQAVYAVDTSLGITDQDSSRWQFWILAGHPFVPAREEIFQSLASIAALCRGIAVDASGFASLRDLCMSCPNKAIAWDGIINERDGQLLEDMGEYVIASLSSNATLRQEVLHGIALLYTTCVATALPHNGTALSISNELWDATARLIEAEQRNWDLQREGSGFEPAFVLGKSDLYLPSKMLTKSSNRSIQMSLYAFSDASSSKRQLKLLADLDSPLLAMLSSGLELSQKAVNQLQDLAHVIGAMPCRDAREAVPYMLLSWLENDTSRPIPTEIPLESLNSMKQSFVHDAWFSWHRNLWDVVPRSLQSQEVQKASMILDSSILAGPCRLHLCSSASHLCLILQDSSDAPLTDFQAHLMRLQLVARHLCGMLSVGEQDYKSIALAEWKAAGLIAGSTVNSLLSGQLGGDEIDEMVSHLINAKHPNSLSSLQVREKVYSAIVASADENLRQAEPIILPALQMLQHPQVAEPTNLAMTLRGQIFVLLGLARLHMSVPPPGSDPAKVYKLQEQRLLHEVEWDVDIQLLVRQEYEKVPGGPSQASIIQNLLERRNNMLEEAANLAGKSPWRPSPPQYLSLQAEISRFKVNFANKDRLLHTIERMIACERTATEEAKAWMSTAKAMVDHLSHDYPAYRDISQPFQLALEEMRYGFSLIITSLDLQNVPDQRVVEGVIADLLAFPTRMDNHGIITDFTRARNTVSKLIGEPSYNSSRNETKADADYDQKTDAVKLQLELLRTFLWRIAQTWRYAPTKLSQAELLGTFQQICCLLLEYWEIAKAEEARRAEEEAQLFKEKRRDETSLDTSDDEILSMERYRESFSLFSEFIEDDNKMTEEDVGGQKRDAQVSKAVYSARDYLTGDIVKDVIAIQSEIYDDKNLGANDWTTTGEQFLRSHTLGLVMLELAGHKLSAHVDDASITGNLYAACLKGSLLVSNRARNDQTLEEETDLDIWVENPKEARLLLGVLSPVSKRVTDLLADWPDHPVLSQMSAIIDRLLSMSIQSPLKAFLTGIEILMSKAQLWEDTAARHVSLQNELKDVAGLARRWRRLELNSWRTILRKTMTTVAEGAYSGWFHLFRILFDENDLTVESTAHAAEEFIKLSPLGEYSTRLDMIKVFGAHLKAINQSQQAPKDRCSALSSMLINLSLYYGQFLPFVQKQIQSAVAPIEKELEDFVALAKWEDRGYYALQLASEKAHKHLQKLRRKVTDILRQPVSNAIGEAAKMMGLQDLTLTDINGVPNQKIAEYSSSCTTAIDVLTNVDGLPLPSSAASTDKSDVWLFDEWMRPGKYTKNIPNLTGRFSELALDGLRASAQSSRQAAGFANDLASEAVERALLLQKDIEKGAKARKKKALVDFLKALGDLGVSKLRTSVPISHRGPNAWLFLVRNEHFGRFHFPLGNISEF